MNHLYNMMFITGAHVFLLQIYTVSQDGALCVWQCDTGLDGLKSRPPKDTAKDKNKSTIDLGDDFAEQCKGEEIHGKASTNKQENREKVKYSRVAK